MVTMSGKGRLETVVKYSAFFALMTLLGCCAPLVLALVLSFVEWSPVWLLRFYSNLWRILRACMVFSGFLTVKVYVDEEA